MADNLLSSFLPDDRASFGIFPQMKPRRRFQDPTGAANVPLDVTRGRVAGLAGLLPDVLNFMGRSPMPTEQFGEAQYEPTPQLPYGSEYFLQNLPLKPTSRIGEVAGQAGAFVPLNPMPAARAVAAGARALGPTAVGMGERYLQSRGLMPGVVEGGAIPGSYEGSSVLMNPKNLTPLNKIEDANKYKSILNSMQEFGYQGRPILAYMDKGQAKALTGSHRLYAARNAGIDVPVVFVKPSVMKWEDKEGLFGTFKESINDQRVYQHLKAAGDDTAASLAKLEDQIYQPAGMLGGPIKPQAPVSELGFYSATEQAALNLPRKSGTGESFLNDLMKGQDVKKDELSWLGLDDYLKGKPNVTRQEVQDFIASNRVDVREVRLGEPSNINKFSDVQLDAEHQRMFGTSLENDYGPDWRTRRQDIIDELANPELESNISGATKYQQYQLPDGENYREILLTMPVDARATYNKIAKEEFSNAYADLTPSQQTQVQGMARGRAQQNYEGVYQSSHFSNEPNILAHMRVNDRVDADGKKMLLIEEIQSDWHQAGREKGYAPKDAESQLAASRDRMTERSNEMRRISNRMAELNDSQLDEFNALAQERQRLVDLQGQETDLGNRIYDAKNYGVPDAPFKDTWHQLALKRALKYAADNGYDRVGLTTGRQQAERYNLAKQVDEIVVPMVNSDGSRSVRIEPTEGGNIKLMVDSNGVVTGYGSGSTQFSGKKLNEVLGKEIADKVMNAQANAKFSGLDLQVGGEGMKKYYDEIYPAFLAKQGKKYNAKTGETKIKTGNAYAQTKGIPAEQSIRYIDISPEMRGGVKKGQPLFTAAPIGGIGLGAGMQDQQQNSINSFIQ